MTDKELLELAAKAAVLSVDDEFECDGGIMVYSDDVNPQCLWNPLTDDGDALRLAVKLLLNVDVDYTDNTVRVFSGRHFGALYSETYKDDRYAATRRAIVRAAAEIGKELK